MIWRIRFYPIGGFGAGYTNCGAGGTPTPQDPRIVETLHVTSLQCVGWASCPS